MAVGLAKAAEMYAKSIDFARRAVAVLFGVCGLGYAVATNLRWEVGSTILGVCTVACLLAAFGLYLEYLARSWIDIRHNGTNAYQFTLAEMLTVTAAVAVMLGFFRMFGASMVAVLVLGIVVIGCAVEFTRLGQERSEDSDSPSDHAQRQASNVTERLPSVSKWKRRVYKYRLPLLFIATGICYALIIFNIRHFSPVPLDRDSGDSPNVIPALPILGREYGWPWAYKMELNDTSSLGIGGFDAIYWWGLIGDIIVGLAIAVTTVFILDRLLHVILERSSDPGR